MNISINTTISLLDVQGLTASLKNTFQPKLGHLQALNWV